jgi:hypothetical protein
VLWLKVAFANLIVVGVGFSIVLFLLPHGVGWVVATVVLTAVAVIILLPKFFRSGGHDAN